MRSPGTARWIADTCPEGREARDIGVARFAKSLDSAVEHRRDGAGVVDGRDPAVDDAEPPDSSAE